MHNPDMTFISTADTPLISSLDAQNVITDGGSHWSLADNWADVQ